MKPDLRISIKDFRRRKNLKVRLTRTPFGGKQFFVRRNGERWPAAGQPVSLTRVMTALRKALYAGRVQQRMERTFGAITLSNKVTPSRASVLSDPLVVSIGTSQVFGGQTTPSNSLGNCFGSTG